MSLGDDTKKIRIVKKKKKGKGDGKSICPNRVEAFSGYWKIGWIKQTLMGLRQKFLIEHYERLGGLMGSTTGLPAFNGPKQIPNREADTFLFMV